ncbi:MAG TPA: tyrosine-type recombinase/integrase [Rectinema sp.]|nr:tyrosine-type recombinase/integrase [Rectinema sp.]
MIAVSQSTVAKEPKTSDLIERFHNDCNLRDMVTTMDYVYRTRAYCAFLETRGKNPLKADRNDLRDFLAHLKAKGLKFRTIDAIYTSLSAFYEFLIIEGLVEYNPVLPFRKYYLRRYKKDNDSETRKLISVEDASKLVNSILDTRDRCILVLLFKTGMRVGELTSLDVDDIDLDKGQVTLKLKKKRTNRVLFLDNEAIAILERWLVARKNRKGGEGQALFLSKIGTRITKRTVENSIEKHAERLSLHKPGARLEDRFTPHCCRHWFVTHLLRAGMSRDFVKELRGDARGEAIDIYNHIDKKELQESYLAHVPQLGI